jgi:alpha-L-glutamate ligase-like protein/uncharacterized protein (TIGR02421 family)
MFKFWDHHGILGINARNLLYIKPLNKKAQIQFADDKMRTKQYLSARGINTARMLGKITNETELLKFNWNALPNDFVLKPNAGFGGEGIWVIGNREGEGWLTIKGEYISQEMMIEHVSDILDGRYSITGSPDAVFFEQRLVSHHDMKKLAKFGLPDIRVIVYNMVPIMAMLRVPTRESNGKANIHVGGLGLGVDLAKGEITHMSHYNKIIKEHPDFGSLKGLKIPFWEEVLLSATQIQQLITLGYLAVDVVIDEDMGPTLLEINARAGLAVQVANLAPLRDRLDRVAGVKVTTAGKGVRMAQDLFGNKIERSIQALSGKKVIGMEEDVTLNLKHGTTNLTARMNPTMTKNYIDERLFKQIAHNKDDKKLTLGYTLQGERGKTLFYPLEMTKGRHQVILGKQALSNFFIDVTKSTEEKKIPSIEEQEETKKPEEKKANTRDDFRHEMDNRLADLDKKLGVVSLLRPLNMDEEKKRFFLSKSYEPQFTYKPVPDDLISVKAELQGMRFDLNHPVERLLDEKRRELILKTDMIEVIGDDKHFPEHCENYFGLPDEEIMQEADKSLKKMKRKSERKQEITSQEASQQMQDFLKERGILNWQVKVKKGIVSRCVVGKNNRLLVKDDELFSQWDIDKLIAHEIETHIYCTENGKLQPYQILRRGTAHYLRTQEGLAVYNQNLAVEGGTRDALLGFHAVFWAREMGFRQLFETLKKYVSEDRAWKTAVKVKRGMSDTGQTGAFIKNALYWWGCYQVEQYMKQGGNYEDLFVGKFEISQIDLVKGIEGLVEPKYLPRSAEQLNS